MAVGPSHRRERKPVAASLSANKVLYVKILTDKTNFRPLLAFLVFSLIRLPVEAADSADVVVYGGTGSGVIAAVRASRMGKRVILVEPSRHLGGITSGGLTATDIGNAMTIGGVAREFYQLVLVHYQDPKKWQYDTYSAYAATPAGKRHIAKDAMFAMEPHVAELLFRRMALEANVEVVYGERLDLANGVTREGNRIRKIQMESGRVFEGAVFIDATSEGDLMARAGVSYIVGREAATKYREQGAGVHVYPIRFSAKPIDPFVRPGDPSSGLLPNIDLGPIPENGASDRGVQAYNYRLCLTQVRENKVVFEKPPDYDEKEYEIFFRLYKMGERNPPMSITPMPSGKSDANNNGELSTDYIGKSDNWAEADYATRDAIAAAHVRYMKGLLWTLANHPRVPKEIRADVSKWGLAKDEFTDNGNWPNALYVREARRMIGSFVMTEHEVLGANVVPDPVAMGSYFMDCHAVRRYRDSEGYVRIDGGLLGDLRFPPYGISYRSLTPKQSECENLLVPICLSASHSAYGSLRMEPVYMMLGEACGVAASLAVDRKLPVQNVPYPVLRDTLLAGHSVLQWPQRAFAGPRIAELTGLAMDDGSAERTGDWKFGANAGGVEGRYQHDGNENKGKASARYRFAVATGGEYEIRISYVANPNRASNVPVTVRNGNNQIVFRVDQRKSPPIDGLFLSLGLFRFSPSEEVYVTVENKDTDGYVVIDAVQMLPVK